MATSGPSLPSVSTATTATFYNTSSTAWKTTTINQADMTTVDGNYGISQVEPGSGNILVVGNFGFSIPSGDAIYGITVTLRNALGLLGGTAGVCALLLDYTEVGVGPSAGDLEGNSLTTKGFAVTGSDQNITLGGEADLWGGVADYTTGSPPTSIVRSTARSWTPADINATSFGVAISVDSSTDGASVLVDAVQVTITHGAPTETTEKLGDQATVTTINNGNGWTNPNNSKVEDGAFATIVPEVGYADNDYLHVQQYGYSLPSAATIQSVDFKVKCKHTGSEPSGVYSLEATALKADGSTSSASATQTLSTSLVEYTLGTGTMYGESWTAAQINDADFGVRLAVSGYSSSSTGATSGSAAVSSGGTRVWNNPTNVFASDNTRATCVSTGSGSTTASNYAFLKVTGFGFSIPSTSTILGFQVTIEKVRSGGTTGNVIDDTVQMLKSDTGTGDNKASTTTWSTIEGVSTYGSSSDLWGSTWTASDVNDSTFGVQLRVRGTTATTNRTANVDRIQISVTYSDAVTGQIQVDSVKAVVSYSGAKMITTSIGQTTNYSIDLAISQALTLLAASISQSESLSVAFGRIKAIASAYAGSETVNAQVSRHRRILTVLNELEQLDADLQRQLSIATSITEQNELDTLLSRLRETSIAISEVMTIDAAVEKLKALQGSIEQIVTNAGSIKIDRSFVSLVTQLVEQTIDVERLRSIAVDVDCTQTIDGAISRSISLLTAINEVETLHGALQRFRTVDTSITEVQAFAAILEKAKYLAAAITESASLVVSLIEHRSMSAAITIAELTDSAIAVFRTIQSAITQSEFVDSALAKQMLFASAVDQLQTIDVALSKLKALIAQIAQQQFIVDTELLRTRSVESTLGQIIEIAASIDRLRAIGIIVEHNQTIDSTINRARGVISEMLQIQGVNPGRINRVRYILTQIAQACNISITLRVRSGSDPSTLTVILDVSRLVPSGDQQTEVQVTQYQWEITKNAPLSTIDLSDESPIVVAVDFPQPITVDVSEIIAELQIILQDTVD